MQKPRRLPFDLSIRMFANVPAGLPLVFYEEVCKSFEEQHASFTVPRYGHILEAVANCVHTLLRENTELQDEQRSILDEGRRLSLNFADESVAFSSSSLSLGHLGQLALLSSGRRLHLDRSQDPFGDRSDAPELHREVFVMHSELAHSREEVRQLSKQKELERDMQEAKLRKAKGEMSQMQLEMDEMQEMQQAHLEEVYVFQEELQKLRLTRTPSDSNRSGLRQEPQRKPPAEERISIPPELNGAGRAHNGSHCQARLVAWLRTKRSSHKTNDFKKIMGIKVGLPLRRRTRWTRLVIVIQNIVSARWTPWQTC